MRMGLDEHKKLSYYSMVDGEGTEMRSEVADEHPWHRINKSEERGKSGNRCNSSSSGGIGLLGADKEGIL